LPFRPASRRAAQASGLFYPESNFQTRLVAALPGWALCG